jgi:hypothetical protein
MKLKKRDKKRKCLSFMAERNRKSGMVVLCHEEETTVEAVKTKALSSVLISVNDKSLY